MVVSQSLISLDPASTLLFHLEYGTEPRSVLKVTNVTSNKVVFKVKTTQPSWYYVRPNQQILEPGQSEEVKVLLVGTECNRFLEAAQAGREEKLEKHRFLVQSKVVSDAEYSVLMSQPASRRNEEFSKLWEGSKDGLQNVKLKVEYSYDFSNAGAQPAEASSQPAASSPGGSPSRTHSEGGQDLRNRLKRSGDSTSNVADSSTGGGGALDNSTSAAGSSSSFPSNATPEAIFAELQSLRRKYDAVVEYTVHLTAERDAIVAQLDMAQTEIAKEKKKNKNEGADGAGANSKAGKKGEKANGDKKVVEKGFSLFVVLFTALICFLIGKYLSM